MPFRHNVQVYSGMTVHPTVTMMELRNAGSPPSQLCRLSAWCNLQYLSTPDDDRLLKPSRLLIRG